MIFVFPPEIQAGIDAGLYEVVKNSAGIPLGTARNKATGRFVGQAIGLIDKHGHGFNPVSVVHELSNLHKGIGSVQAGLQGIQASLGVLQTMTLLSGVGVVANIGISAVSLWQILKLREDVKQQRIEMREGFLDLKQAFKDQGIEILQKIDAAVHEIEFNQHRQILALAYGRFLEATRLMKDAMSCSDLSVRNADLANARQILTEALADYKNPHLLADTNAFMRLRRLECVWAIEQTIAVTYQLQNQTETLSNRLGQLQSAICQDTAKVAQLCESEDELEVIFPEITRIRHQDLVVLKLWQDQVDWARSLSSSEQKLLQEAVFNQASGIETASEIPIPPEQLLYDDLKQKTHFLALRDSLQLMMVSSTRKQYEDYIYQQATQTGHRALEVKNLQKMTDLSVANLYWYFKVGGKSQEAPEAVASVKV